MSFVVICLYRKMPINGIWWNMLKKNLVSRSLLECYLLTLYCSFEDIIDVNYIETPRKLASDTHFAENSHKKPGLVARSEVCPLGMQATPSSIPTSGTFFRGVLVMKTFLQPFSLFHLFKKSSCQLLVKECALSTGKLPRRLAQEQCD